MAGSMHNINTENDEHMNKLFIKAVECSYASNPTLAMPQSCERPYGSLALS